MKKLFSIAISLVFTLSSVLFVSAAETVSFALGSVEAENNRIVSVDVYADTKSGFSSAIFDFTFDKTALEFKDVDSDENTTIKYNPTSGGVRVVYLCLIDSALSNKSIFKLDFKTLKEGRADIAFTVGDCANYDAKSIEVGNCSGGSITVSGSVGGSGSKSSKDASAASSSKSSKNSKSGKDGNDTSDILDDTDDDEMKSNGELNDVNSKSWNLNWLLYVLIGLGVVIILITGVKIGMNIAAKKAKKGEKPGDNE